LLLKQEGASMSSVDLSTRECGGHVAVELRGELYLVDAAGVAAALAAVAAREPDIIVDLAALEFIDSSGVAALARGRKQARRGGGDLLLAARAALMSSEGEVIGWSPTAALLPPAAAKTPAGLTSPPP
jgi:anti-sigma B factor antagonist